MGRKGRLYVGKRTDFKKCRLIIKCDKKSFGATHKTGIRVEKIKFKPDPVIYFWLHEYKEQQRRAKLQQSPYSGLTGIMVV